MNKKFVTHAEYYSRTGETGKTVEIEIKKQGKNIFINGKKVVMILQGTRLRFRIKNSDNRYVVLDNHNPPIPIAEMFRQLKD